MKIEIENQNTIRLTRSQLNQLITEAIGIQNGVDFRIATVSFSLQDSYVAGATIQRQLISLCQCGSTS